MPVLTRMAEGSKVESVQAYSGRHVLYLTLLYGLLPVGQSRDRLLPACAATYMPWIRICHVVHRVYVVPS